ncbi:UNVERIFIED_CONTAM: carboxypeptidase C prc1 [Siphonaria sp. JEL0065]|nr:carboxypeptidase C prc1 [Siphonaria sp. JEL0065]
MANNNNNQNPATNPPPLPPGAIAAIAIAVIVLCVSFTICYIVHERSKQQRRRVQDEEATLIHVPEKATQQDLERLSLRAELGLTAKEMEYVVDDLSPYYALKAERLQRIASLLSLNLSLFENVGFPPDENHNPLILVLKQIGELQKTGHHEVETTTPVAKTFLENCLSSAKKCLPTPLSLTSECIQHLEAMAAALQKVQETQKSEQETEDAFEARLKATREAAEKTCSDAETNMRKTMDQVESKMTLMEAETEKFKRMANEAENARVALEIKAKEDEAATKARIKQLRAELSDLESTELQLMDDMSKQEVMSLLEELIGEKVSRINRLAAVSAEFYKLLKTLHFPQEDPLSQILITLPNGLPDNPSQRALQLRAKQVFAASLSSTKSLPKPFVFTRAYIEALEDRRDEVRDQVMELEAKKGECKHVMDEITKLYEQLNIPNDDRKQLTLEISKIDEYTIISKELREKWDSIKQGEVDKDRLQAVRDELLDLKASEFALTDANSKEERWSNLELLVTEKVRRITHIANLTSELYLLYTSTTGIPDKTIQETLLKSFLITLPSGLQDPPSLDALQTHGKEMLNNYFTLNHSLPKPLSIARSCAAELQGKIDTIKKVLKEKAEKEEQLRRVIMDIKELWDQLSTQEKERTVLVEDVAKLKEYTAIADKLRKKWSETMKLEIDGVVEQLKSVWSDCGTPKEEQDAFWAKCKPIYSPTSLAEMRKEIASATLRRERGMKINKLIQERKDFLQKLVEFERAAADPSRFAGSSLRLLEEEKFRKSALPNLKKMENGIRKMLNEYEEVSERPFYLEGRPYIEALDDEVKDRLSNTSVLVFFAKK